MLQSQINGGAVDVLIDEENEAIAKQRKREIMVGRAFLALGLLVLCAGAQADISTDELGDGLCRVVNMLSGKFLFAFAVIATLASGVTVLFGAELTDGVKKTVSVIAIVGMILSVGSIMSMAYNKFASASCATVV